MAKTKRCMKIDALVRKASPAALSQNRNIVDDVIDMTDPESPGVWVRRKQARRVNHVFENLFTAGRIDSEQRHAAGDLVDLFARSRGLYGVAERSLERVQGGTSDAMTQMRIRAAHGRRFDAILARLPPRHAGLLTALVTDLVMGDGAGTYAVRWREVVRACLGAACPRAPYEGKAVAEALAGLPQAVVDERRARRKTEIQGAAR